MTDLNTPALLSCPFCGSECTRVIGGPGTVGGPKHWAGCDHCHGRAWGDTEAEAIAAWNARPALAAQPAEGVMVPRDADYQGRSCRGIPDWALANAYRKAVDRMNPQASGSALVFAADVTVAADHLAENVLRDRRGSDYSKDPIALANWLHVHYRNSWDDQPNTVPEIVWIYQMLIKAATPLSEPPKETR